MKGSNLKLKNLIIGIVMLILGGGVGFFAGMKYQQSRQPAFLRNLTNQQRQARGQLASRAGFRPVNGEIISVDEKSITVKLADGSSKIVFLSENTQINKAEKTSKEDLKVGEKVVVFGAENSDGSLTAQNIQLNPQLIGR